MFSAKNANFQHKCPSWPNFFDNFYPMCKIVGIVLTRCEGKFCCLTNAASNMYIPVRQQDFFNKLFFR